MAFKSPSFLFAILLISVVPIPNEAGKPGKWWPVKDLNNPEVVMVAKFAVTEHNKKANINLQFINVIKCQEQVSSGSLYKVVISAKNGTTSHPKNYEAIVWLRPWEKKDLLTLKSFKKVWCGPCG